MCLSLHVRHTNGQIKYPRMWIFLQKYDRLWKKRYLCRCKYKSFTMMDATVTPERRISRTARFARANKGLIYEVTDPVLRSQLCYYRNKERKAE